jgi:hypothetical protein
MQPLQALAPPWPSTVWWQMLLAADRNVRNRRPAASRSPRRSRAVAGDRRTLWPVGKPVATYEVGRDGQPIADCTSNNSRLLVFASRSRTCPRAECRCSTSAELPGASTRGR